MKTIKIKGIALQNWRGQNINVVLQDGKNTIKGKNGIGKTSLMEAYLWCLTGYSNPTLPKNFNLYNNSEELSKDTPCASVVLSLDIDGNSFTIERQASPNFIRKRGSNEYVKSASDSYKYLIDNIEYSVNDFQNWVSANIAPMANITYCLSGAFFSALCEEDKNKARDVLQSIIGEVNKDDFKGNYDEIWDKLQTLGADALEEQIKNTIKPLNKRLDEIPAIIADNERIIAEYSSNNFAAIKSDIEALKGKIEGVDKAILSISERNRPLIEKCAEIDKAIAEIKSKINSAKIAYNSASQEKIASLKMQLKGINAENERIDALNNNIKNNYARLSLDKDMYEQKLLVLNNQRNTLLKQRDEVKGRVFTATTCAYCGAELNVDKLEELMAAFNAKRDEELQRIVANGKATKAEIDYVEGKIKELKASIDKGYNLIDKKSCEDITRMIEEENAKITPYEDSEEYKSYMDKIANLEASKPTISTNYDEEKTSLMSEKRGCIEEITSLSQKMGLKNEVDNLMRRNIALQEEQREVGNKIAMLEGNLNKIKEWREEKAQIISDRVNVHLSDCKIVMFSHQKDGTIKPDCVITGKNSTKYATLNNSDRIKVNISLQKLFCNHYNVNLPCWIDEASIFSPSTKLELDCQYIMMYASDDSVIKVNDL